MPPPPAPPIADALPLPHSPRSRGGGTNLEASASTVLTPATSGLAALASPRTFGRGEGEILLSPGESPGEVLRAGVVGRVVSREGKAWSAPTVFRRRPGIVVAYRCIRLDGGILITVSGSGLKNLLPSRLPGLAPAALRTRAADRRAGSARSPPRPLSGLCRGARTGLRERAGLRCHGR